MVPHLLSVCRVLVRVLLVCPTLFLTVLAWLLRARCIPGRVIPVRILKMTVNVSRLMTSLRSGIVRMSADLFLFVVRRSEIMMRDMIILRKLNARLGWVGVEDEWSYEVD